VSADDPSVSEVTSFNMEFINPIPLNIGCIVTITFPNQFTISTSVLTSVTGWGLFGSVRELYPVIDENTRTIRITDGCRTYKSAGLNAKMVFSSIRNPSYVSTTDSFTIQITDSLGYQVAAVTSGITYTPQSGGINGIALSASDPIVSKTSTLTLTFAPLHSLTTSSAIYLSMPSEVLVTCASISSTTVIQAGHTCTEPIANRLKISNPFSSAYNYGTPISITFSGITMPSSAVDITTLTIETYTIISSVEYSVDSATTSSVLLSINPDLFASASVSANTYQTYTSATFTFTLITQNIIPIGGFIKVELPSQLTVEDEAYISCDEVQSLDDISCTTEQGGFFITVANGF